MRDLNHVRRSSRIPKLNKWLASDDWILGSDLDSDFDSNDNSD